MTEVNQTTSGRDARGRFGPGNPGGPGGSRKRAELRRAMEDALKPEHLVAMLHKAARKGLGGDLGAMRLVFEHTVGRPPQAAVEPEALDIRLPELHTQADCRRATGLVLAGLTSGKLTEEAAQTLLDGIKTCMQTLRMAQKERGASGPGRPVRQLPDRVLRALFRRFKKTGELPEDTDEAAAVIDKVVAGFDLAAAQEPGVLTVTSLGGFVAKHRPRALNMDSLFSEAVYAPGMIKAPARQCLRIFATAGRDVTSDLLKERKIPEFGPVSWHLIGLDKFIVRGRHKAQAKRLLKRIAVAQERDPADYDLALDLRHRRQDALACFACGGERPDDPEIFEDVLLAGEFMALLLAAAGVKEADVLRLFDTAAQKTGEEREAAITQLLELAKAGRFMGREEAA